MSKKKKTKPVFCPFCRRPADQEDVDTYGCEKCDIWFLLAHNASDIEADIAVKIEPEIESQTQQTHPTLGDMTEVTADVA